MPTKNKEVRSLEKLVKQQSNVITRLRKVRAKPLAAALGRRDSRTRKLTVYCTDSHGAYQDEVAIKAFLGDLKTLDPGAVVHGGDALDCGGFLSSHGTLGVVAEMAISYEDDTMATNNFFDAIQSNVRKRTPFTYVEGNHENRIRRWVATQVLSNARDAQYIESLIGVEKVLSIKERGIRFIRRDTCYDGFDVSGTFKIGDKLACQHGEAFAGKSAVFRQLDRLGHSVVFGHSHRLVTAYGEKLTGQLVAINGGCLCQRRPVYGLTKTTDWVHGYVVCVTGPGGFFAFPVPIVNGVSYLRQLI